MREARKDINIPDNQPYMNNGGVLAAARDRGITTTKAPTRILNNLTEILDIFIAPPVHY